jgi:hypothetical protein
MALQQFRETLPGDHPYRFVIHDRDAILSVRLDDELTGFGRFAAGTIHSAAPRTTKLYDRRKDQATCEIESRIAF